MLLLRAAVGHDGEQDHERCDEGEVVQEEIGQTGREWLTGEEPEDAEVDRPAARDGAQPDESAGYEEAGRRRPRQCRPHGAVEPRGHPQGPSPSRQDGVLHHPQAKDHDGEPHEPHGEMRSGQHGDDGHHAETEEQIRREHPDDIGPTHAPQPGLRAAEGDPGKQDRYEREQDAERAGVEAVQQSADNERGKGQGAHPRTSSTPRMDGFSLPPQQMSQ